MGRLKGYGMKGFVVLAPAKNVLDGCKVILRMGPCWVGQ